MTNKVDLFLDSGAFSAWSQGAVIDIQEYIEFIKKHEDHVTVYANLDVIGDVKGTWKNQRIMERAGLKPLPVFHLGDPMPYLDRCLEYEYFCLGGMAGQGCTTEKRISFLDRCWAVICDTPDRLPKSRVHGFGMTSLKLMLRYPWYSVDSTSWVVTGRVGGVFVPQFKNGKWIYDKDGWKIQVSSRSSAKNEAGKHIDSFSPKMREVILDYFEHKGYQLGKSEFRVEDEDYELEEDEKWSGKAADGKREVETIVERGLCNEYRLRDELNIVYFVDLEKSMPKYPWPYKKKGSKGFSL